MSTMYPFFTMLLMGALSGDRQPPFDIIHDLPAIWRAAAYLDDPQRLAGYWRFIRVERGKVAGFSWGNNISYWQFRFEKGDIFPLEILKIDSPSTNGPMASWSSDDPAFKPGYARLGIGKNRELRIVRDLPQKTLSRVGELLLNYEEGKDPLTCNYEIRLSNPNELRTRFDWRDSALAKLITGPLPSKDDVLIFEKMVNQRSMPGHMQLHFTLDVWNAP